MASKRKLKKTMHYISSELITDVFFKTLISDKVNEAKADELVLTSTLGHPNSNNFASNLCSSVKSMMWDTSPFVVLALI